MIFIVHLFVLFWMMLGNTTSNSEPDRLPLPPVNYRYFADIGQRAPGQIKRRPLRGRLLQYSIDIRDNYACLRRENAP